MVNFINQNLSEFIHASGRFDQYIASLIQGVSGLTYKTYRGDRGGRGEQKIIREGEGGLKCNPGEIFAKYWFVD